MGVAYKLNEMSQTKVILDVTGAPDTENTMLPGSPTVRPTQLTLFAYASKGHWAITAAHVSGLKVLDAAKDRLTKRDYVVPFMSVDEEDTETPEWILEIVDKETARLDAVGGEDFDELLEESSLGAPHVKAATDGIPEDRKEQLRKAVERSSQRVAFDTALNVLLIRENLDGTEWAIQQIRETATKAGYLEDDAVADVLNGLVGQLESLLDMRTSQLAAKTWGH